MNQRIQDFYALKTGALPGNGVKSQWRKRWRSSRVMRNLGGKWWEQVALVANMIKMRCKEALKTYELI